MTSSYPTTTTTPTTATTSSTATTPSATTEKKKPVAASKIGNDVIPTFSTLSYRQEPTRRPNSINFFLENPTLKSSSFLTTPDMYL